MVALLPLVSLSGQAEPARHNGSGKSHPVTNPSADVFAPGPLRKIKVEISKPSLKKLNQDNRRYVAADFLDGETVLRNVGVHMKGAAGSFRALDDRPALTVKFDAFVPGQNWHGLDKIHLNNSVQDGSLLTENICGELFRQAGVPATRAGNVRFVLNNRDLGVYVLKEGFDKVFLRQYYPRAKGNLYDGGFCHDIDQPLDKISGTPSKDQPEIKALLTAAHEPDPNRRFQKLQKLLDLDRFISFCALEVMTWDWDGYVLKPNNYKLYWDPDTGKITFFPHGMDQMFWEPNGPIMPDFNGLLARALVETPEGKRLYRARMAELTTNVFRVEAITNRLCAYAAHNRAALAEIDANAARDYDGQVQRIRDLVLARAAFLRKQLVPVPSQLRFENGIARPIAWTIENEPAVAKLDQVQDSTAKPTLTIQTSEKTMASWRCRGQLPLGHYRFEGMARVSGVVAIQDRRGEGAGLRISHNKEARTNKLTGSSEWTKLEYEFEVTDPSEDIILVCELRATKGQVWFDRDSLRVVKMR